jgi:WD40-like Beta Propeller Repeat
MTLTNARFDRELPAILEGLYLGPIPSYRDEVLAVATHRRQRPAWAIPGRWLPMADIAVRPVPVARLPLRAVGVGLLLLALLVAVLAFVGSRSKVPPPFGVAANGLVTWATDGDIFVGDPATGTVKRVVASDDLDRNPFFSRDGTHLAFLRQVPEKTGHFDLMVTRPDGTEATLLSPVPIRMPEQVQWAPDSRSMIVNDADHRLTQLFLDGSPPKVLLEGAVIEPEAFRPPDGAEILYGRDGDAGTLYVMNADGTNPRQLFGPRTAPCECVTGPARWSPDGSTVAVQVGTNYASHHVWVIDVATGAGRPVTTESDNWVEDNPAWSPDGMQIAFNRWEHTEPGDWENRATGIVGRNGGPVMSVGVAPSTDGGLLEWSPDAKSILVLPMTVYEGFKWSPGAPGTIARPTLIDLSTGGARQLDWSVGSASSWQRTAR